MFNRKLSLEQLKELEPEMAKIARAFLEKWEEGLGPPGSETNPLVIHPHTGDELKIGCKPFVPFEVKGTWYVVSGKLTP